MSGKSHFQELHDVIRELVSQLSVEETQDFLDILYNKLEELRNEQAANLQENIGASRQG